MKIEQIEQSRVLLAQTCDERFTLLQNGKPKVIGRISPGKAYLDGAAHQLWMIELTYGTQNSDSFYWDLTQDEPNQGKLIFHSICLTTPAWLCDVYRDCLAEPGITPQQFIDKVTSVYTIKMLGF